MSTETEDSLARLVERQSAKIKALKAELAALKEGEHRNCVHRHELAEEAAVNEYDEVRLQGDAVIESRWLRVKAALNHHSQEKKSWSD